MAEQLDPFDDQDRRPAREREAACKAPPSTACFLQLARDQELVDLLGQVELVQQSARKNLRAGTVGAEIFENANAALRECSASDKMFFAAHGMGIVSHEAPWLMSDAFPRYTPRHRDKQLEAGMVISIETELHHTERGFIKLEDTVAITPTGCEGFGDHGRGWNIAGR